MVVQDSMIRNSRKKTKKHTKEGGNKESHPKEGQTNRMEKARGESSRIALAVKTTTATSCCFFGEGREKKVTKCNTADSKHITISSSTIQTKVSNTNKQTIVIIECGMT
jgi:hypothetical protein